jgi:hypothetical protein
MRAAMDPALRRDRYLRVLLDRPPWQARWQALREAAPLPLGWRLRKLLAEAAPSLALQLKRRQR